MGRHRRAHEAAVLKTRSCCSLCLLDGSTPQSQSIASALVDVSGTTSVAGARPSPPHMVWSRCAAAVRALGCQAPRRAAPLVTCALRCHVAPSKGSVVLRRPSRTVHPRWPIGSHWMDSCNHGACADYNPKAKTPAAHALSLHTHALREAGLTPGSPDHSTFGYPLRRPPCPSPSGGHASSERTFWSRCGPCRSEPRSP